ncbi:MAG TPA: cell division FtsA domain-containing protein [Lachnospiraceae bacterium]|nr:cell division FtsA domain-containing protein [Lachnospiraceae bacterium]
MAGIGARRNLIFGLDIGTRSIVGTVGYKEEDRFIVVAQQIIEHETRAMIDGQIHDIKKVGETIASVTAGLEDQIGKSLKEVCIAAAGRVLRTITTHVDYVFSEDRVVVEEDVYALSAMGVDEAYSEFYPSNDSSLKFYCVGYSIIRYYMNHYPIGNPQDHKAGSIGADMIVTFLPEDVVDGLHKAVEYAGLKVANLTLEPIAAIQVAIPDKFRMLNIALVDVGAGTSDISITKEGAIVAYGMIPVAGDSLTEAVAQHCLVDFNTADVIKKQILGNETQQQDLIQYTDIMGLPQSVSAATLLSVLKPVIDEMTEKVAGCIKQLNGDKNVSAVFVVGGGGKIPGYTKALAEKLDIVKERVAVRGEDVMGFVDFPEHAVKDSTLVTPIGICLSFYVQNNNFIFVTFNEKRLKIYDNGKLSVVDAAIQFDFPNDGLFPKRGMELQFTVEGKSHLKRGEFGEAAIITVNKEPADIHTLIKANDVINVIPSTYGEPARQTIGNLSEYHQFIKIMVNGKPINLPKFAQVNDDLQSEYYEIQNGDVIVMLNYYTVSQVLEFMDIILPKEAVFQVNDVAAKRESLVYENFTVSYRIEEPVHLKNISGEHDICVTVNKSKVTMHGKALYVYVDIFDYINFDLSKPKGGGIVTNLNGQPAEFLKEINEGDVIDIYWKN